MKTQFSFSKSGFTMIEIMVVIAIIGSMFALVSQINFRSQENMTKAERIANKIQGILHTSSVSVMMWRMDQYSTGTTWANITISRSGSIDHGVSWHYVPTVLSGTLVSPFFDNDPKYEIQSIKWCRWTNSGMTDTVDIIIDKNGTTFTGASAPFPADANVLEIQVRYIDMAKKIVFDRRTGRTEIRRSGEDLCN